MPMAMMATALIRAINAFVRFGAAADLPLMSMPSEGRARFDVVVKGGASGALWIAGLKGGGAICGGLKGGGPAGALLPAGPLKGGGPKSGGGATPSPAA